MRIKGDDSLENSDWIKSRTWDLPYENLEQYLRNYAPSDQREAVRHLMGLPVFKAAPPVFRVEAEMFVAGSALKFVDGEFITKYDDSQERDENGRWTDGGASGASAFPVKEQSEAFARNRAADKAWSKIRQNKDSPINWLEDANGNLYPDPTNNPPETMNAWRELMDSAAACWGSEYITFYEGEKTLSVEGEWLARNFSTVDSAGNPTDSSIVVGPDRYGADLELWKLRDEYVVPDDKTLRMNAGLRDGRSSTKADRIDEWVNSSTVKEPVVLYRGATMSSEQVATLQPGFSYVDKGFQSTAPEPNGAEFYLRVREGQDNESGKNLQPVLMRYVIEPGTHAANAGAGEFVVQRNTTNTVIGRNDVDGVTYITMGVRGNG